MTTLHYLLVAFIVWFVFCRARHMEPTTPISLKIQHGASMVLALLSLPMWPGNLDRWAPQLLGGALFIFLWIDLIHWRAELPPVPPRAR